MSRQTYDLVVIGGGINGAGVAADAAGRGLAVRLVEMGDLAGGTSSASSKLVHGGLRYLEHREFRLVREALAEREVMLERAPHIVWPLRFVLPHIEGMRSRLMLRAGLFLYDHLASRRRIPGSRAIDFAHDPSGAALDRRIRNGFAYWDCWVDDARLVLLNARLAADLGAVVSTRTRVTALDRGEEAWAVTLDADGARETCRARVIVNAAGPWADAVSALARDNGMPGQRPRLKLVKGSHIVVRRIAGADDAFILQNTDGRVVFLLPFESDFTLIGTTDIPVAGDPGEARCTPDEEAYLLAAANRFLARPLGPADIVWRYAGVRPLQAGETDGDPSALSRDYDLHLSGSRHGDALLTILGGKVTTYRCLAEEVMRRLQPLFARAGPSWTSARALPGGDIPGGDFAIFREALARLHAWVPEPLMDGLARRHGTRIGAVLGDARRLEDLGADLGGGLTEREVRYLAAHEWARTPDDVLWRRTKAGLHFADATARAVAAERIARLL
jgi:glycerol-3-phosphate dehydrogenase